MQEFLHTIHYNGNRHLIQSNCDSGANMNWYSNEYLQTTDTPSIQGYCEYVESRGYSCHLANIMGEIFW